MGETEEAAGAARAAAASRWEKEKARIARDAALWEKRRTESQYILRLLGLGTVRQFADLIALPVSTVIDVLAGSPNYDPAQWRYLHGTLRVAYKAGKQSLSPKDAASVRRFLRVWPTWPCNWR